MAKIKPFRAFTYNQDEVKDLSKVVCPPYDVISPSSQQYFQEISPYNLDRFRWDSERSVLVACTLHHRAQGNGMGGNYRNGVECLNGSG